MGKDSGWCHAPQFSLSYKFQDLLQHYFLLLHHFSFILAYTLEEKKIPLLTKLIE